VACGGIDTLDHLLDEVWVGTGELEVLKALPLVHILHHVQEALVGHSHVSRSDGEGLGGIILWLDAVCRVVLSEVEHAACKYSRISWALRMD
jgi:hypothetical protein